MPPSVLPFGVNGPPPASFQGDVTTDPASNNNMTFDGTSFKAQREYMQDLQGAQTAANWAVTHPIFTVPNDGSKWVVDSPPSMRVGAASTSGTFQIEVTPSGTALGSGTAQTVAIATNALTNQTVNGVSLLAQTVLNAGDSLSVVWAGTVTGQTLSSLVVPMRRVR